MNKENKAAYIVNTSLDIILAKGKMLSDALLLYISYQAKQL